MKTKSLLYLSILVTIYIVVSLFPIRLAGVNIWLFFCAYFMEYFGFWKILVITHSLLSVEILLSFPFITSASGQLRDFVIEMANKTATRYNATGNLSDAIAYIPSEMTLSLVMVGAIFLGWIWTLWFEHWVVHRLGVYKRFPL